MIDIVELQTDISERLDAVMVAKRAALEEQAKEVAIDALANKIIQEAIQEQMQAIELQMLVLEGKEKNLVEQILERIVLLKQEVRQAMPYKSNNTFPPVFDTTVQNDNYKK